MTTLSELLRIRFDHEIGKRLSDDINDDVDYNHLLEQYRNTITLGKNENKLVQHIDRSKLLWNPKHIKNFISLGNEKNMTEYITALLSTTSLQSLQISITLNVVKEKLKILRDGLIESTFNDIKKTPHFLFINKELKERIQKRRSSLKDLVMKEYGNNNNEHRSLILQHMLNIHKLSEFDNSTDLEYSLKLGEISSCQSPRADEHHSNYLSQMLKMVYSHCGIGTKEMGRSSIKMRTNIVYKILRQLYDISEEIITIDWGINNDNNHVLDRLTPINSNNNDNIRDDLKKKESNISVADAHLLYGEPEVVLAYAKLLQLRHPNDKKYNHNFTPLFNPHSDFYKLVPNEIPASEDNICIYNNFISDVVFGYRWKEHIFFKNAPKLQQGSLFNMMKHLQDIENVTLNDKRSPVLYSIKSMCDDVLKKIQSCLYSIYTDVAPSMCTTASNKDILLLGSIMCNLFLFKLIDLVHISRCNITNRSIYSVTIDSPYYASSHPNNQLSDKNNNVDSLDKKIYITEDMAKVLELSLSGERRGNNKGTRICIFFDVDSSSPISMVSFSPHSGDDREEKKSNDKMAKFSIGEFRGLTADIIDSVSSAVRRYHTSAEAVVADIKEERQILRKTGATHTFEKELTKSIERLDIDALNMRRGGKDAVEILDKDGKTITSTISALRKNETSMTSFLDELGVKASETVNEPCALEIAETYPDCRINRIEKEAKTLEGKLPPEEIDYLNSIENDSRFHDEDFLKESLKKSKTANIVSDSIAKKLSNGVVDITGRFGKVLIYGGVTYAAIAVLTSSTIHSSRGAHYNVIARYSPSGVKSYKILKYSCEDKSSGNGQSIEHPFETHISQYIATNISSLEKGAYVENPNTKWQSKTKGYAPICCQDDVNFHGPCGGWAVFSDTSVLGALVSEQELPKGASLTCDSGLSVVGAMSDMMIASATDVSKKIIDGVIDVSTETGDRLIMKIVQSPFFIVGLPLIIAGVHGIERCDVKYFIVLFLILFLVLLLARFLIIKYFSKGNEMKDKQDDSNHYMSQSQ